MKYLANFIVLAILWSTANSSSAGVVQYDFGNAEINLTKVHWFARTFKGFIKIPKPKKLPDFNRTKKGFGERTSRMGSPSGYGRNRNSNIGLKQNTGKYGGPKGSSRHHQYGSAGIGPYVKTNPIPRDEGASRGSSGRSSGAQPNRTQRADGGGTWVDSGGRYKPRDEGASRGSSGRSSGAQPNRTQRADGGTPAVKSATQPPKNNRQYSRKQRRDVPVDKAQIAEVVMLIKDFITKKPRSVPAICRVDIDQYTKKALKSAAQSIVIKLGIGAADCVAALRETRK